MISPDLGPIYTETVRGLESGLFPVEPWNTWSNLVFVLLVIDISYRTRLSARDYPLIVYSLPVLIVGIVGGTVYHATRSHFIWLFLDFMPILLLTSAAALSYWRIVTRSWALAVPCFLLVAISGRLAGLLITHERTVQISLGYLSAALSLILPLALIVRRGSWRGVWLLLGTILSFASAVTFRTLDRGGAISPLPMGTHFLWHIFGGFSVWMLMILTIQLKQDSLTK